MKKKRGPQIPFKLAFLAIFLLCFIFIPIKNKKSGLTLSYNLFKSIYTDKKVDKNKSIKNEFSKEDEEKLKTILK